MGRRSSHNSKARARDKAITATIPPILANRIEREGKDKVTLVELLSEFANGVYIGRDGDSEYQRGLRDGMEKAASKLEHSNVTGPLMAGALVRALQEEQQ